MKLVVQWRRYKGIRVQDYGASTGAASQAIGWSKLVGGRQWIFVGGLRITAFMFFWAFSED